jgi:hypothetical protein
MARVFVSFVHEDQAVAKAVQGIIRAFIGVDVFLSTDQTQVFAGDIWLQKIRQSLEEAELVILMLSNRSVRRAWVNFEAGAAWLTNKPIIPCCYGNMSKAKLPHPYSAIQALDLPDQLEYLLDSVCHHLRVDYPDLADVKESGREFDRLVDALKDFVDIEGAFVTKKKKKDGESATPSPEPPFGDNEAET